MPIRLLDNATIYNLTQLLDETLVGGATARQATGDRRQATGKWELTG